MSNDRLFLYCGKCKTAAMVGKYWPNQLAGSMTEDAIWEFIREHVTHGPDSHVDLGNKPIISLESEASLPRDSDYWREFGREYEK